jgi:hypothetical protein
VEDRGVAVDPGCPDALTERSPHHLIATSRSTVNLTSKRVAAWAAAGAVIVAGAVAASAPAQATSTFTCNSSNYGYLLAVGGTSPYDLWNYRYTGVKDGSIGTFAARVDIGSGWNTYGMIRAGKDGVIYGWNAAGALRYYDWAVGGTTYTTSGKVVKAPGTDGVTANGSDTAWGSWSSTTNRNKVAVDRNNNIFTLDSTGILRRYNYNATTNTWSAWGVAVGQLRGSYDMLWASDTALWARKTDGTLVRLRWDAATDRIETEWAGGAGWGKFKYLTSSGGDVLYGVQASDGALYKYRFDEDTSSFPVGGIKIGNSGWQNFLSVTAVGNSCARTYPATATVPASIAQDSPISVVSTPTKKISLAYSDNVGFLRYGYIADSSTNVSSGNVVWTNVQDSYASAGRPALYQQPGTNKVSLLAHTTTGDIVSREETAVDTGTLTPWFDENGAQAGDPTAYTTSDSRAGMLAADSSGTVWMKDQSGLNTPRDFYAWRKLPLTGLPAGAALTATNAGSGKVLVSAVNAAGHVVASTVNVTALTTTAWTDLGVPDGVDAATGRVAAAAYPGGSVRLAVSDALGQVWTTRQDSTTFAWAPSWTRVAPTQTVKGSPSMVLSPASGLVEIVARDVDDSPMFAQEDQQGSGTFAQFKQVDESGFLKFDTDPTAFTYTTSGGQAWAFVGYDANRAVTLTTAGTGSPNLMAAKTSGATTSGAEPTSVEPAPTFTTTVIRKGDNK